MSPDNSLDFAATRVQHTPMRLLIIEDDRDAADYLVKAFREVGHVADWSADGEDGLALALDGDYDVLIVDRMLPQARRPVGDQRAARRRASRRRC